MEASDRPEKFFLFRWIDRLSGEQVFVREEGSVGSVE